MNNTTVRVLELSKDNVDMYDSCMQKCMEQNINNNADNDNADNDGRIKNTFFDDTKSEEDIKSNFYPEWQERWGPASFKVGDNIEVRLRDNESKLLSGIVTNVHDDDKLDLLLNNGNNVSGMAPKYVSKVEEEGGSVSSSGPAGSDSDGGAAPPPPKTKVKGKKTKGKKTKGKKSKGKKTKGKKTKGKKSKGKKSRGKKTKGKKTKGKKTKGKKTKGKNDVDNKLKYYNNYLLS
jgi:hypothetical protein